MFMYLRMRVGVDGLGPLPLPVEVAQVQRPPGHGVRRAGHRHDAHVAVQADLGGRLAEEGKQAPDEGVVADEVDSHLQLEAVLGPPRLVRIRGEEAATLNGTRKSLRSSSHYIFITIRSKRKISKIKYVT